MVTTQRQFFRKKLGEELKEEGKSARKILKRAKKKRTYHNQMCVLIGAYKEIR